MKTTKTTKTTNEETNIEVNSNKGVSPEVKAKIKPRGLWGLYEGKMFLNGTSNEVFNLGM